MQVTNLIYKPNPLREKYKAHKGLAIVAIVRFDNESYIRRFFRTEKEVVDWFWQLYDRHCVVVH